MDSRAETAPHRALANAASILGALSSDEARLLMAAAADVVVVVGPDLRVQDVAYRDPSLTDYAPAEWIGREFTECVTPDSADKARALVSGALGGRVLVGRQVNHPHTGAHGVRHNADLAITYRAVAVGRNRHFLLLGTDMRPITELQSRLVRTQLDLDRDIRSLREAETRYRLLFSLADAPLLIVQVGDQEVVDANDRAGEMFGRPSRKLVGMSLPALFARSDQTDVAAKLAAIAARGRPGRIEGALGKGEESVTLAVEPYREIGGNQLLVRGLVTDGTEPTEPQGGGLRAVIGAMPDGVLVVDRGGYIVDANDAALDFVRLSSRDRLIGRRADRWIGGTAVDMQVLLSNLRDEGSIRRFATVVRDELGGQTAVDISATHATDGTDPVYGIVLREAMSFESEVEPQPYGTSQFTDLVGRVSLRDLVRDTADIIEKLCIEEALRQTENNRASAADMLGLSRQSLYMKLKRYGLEDGPREVA